MDKNKILIIISLIILALLFILAGFEIHNIVNNNKNKETTVVDTQDESNLKNDLEEEISTKDETLYELGEELFKMTQASYISDISYYGRYFLFYDYKSIKYEDLRNINRLEAAYRLIESMYAFDDTFSIYDECFDGVNDGEMIKCYREKITVDMFGEYYHKLFGNDKEIIYETFSNYYGDSCFIENNEISCYPYSPVTGGDTYSTISYINYDYIEEKDNEIIIYVSQFIRNYNNTTKKDEIYKEYDMEGNLKNKIADVASNFSFDEIFEKYSNQTSKYKVTFKKEENKNNLNYVLLNNDYYWYSTEYIK